MEKIKKAWAEFLPYERVFYVLGMICAVVTIIFAVISFWWRTAGLIYQPTMGFMIFSQGIYSWRRSRRLAVFSLCVAGFIFAVTIGVYVMEFFC